jgi:hypothetical protein
VWHAYLEINSDLSRPRATQSAIHPLCVVMGALRLAERFWHCVIAQRCRRVDIRDLSSSIVVRGACTHEEVCTP